MVAIQEVSRRMFRIVSANAVVVNQSDTGGKSAFTVDEPVARLRDGSGVENR